MSEEVITPQKVEGTGKIVSAGKPEKFEVKIPLGVSPTEELAVQPDTDIEQKVDVVKEPEAVIPQTETPLQPVPLTDEEIKAEYERRFPTESVLTDEQKAKKEEAFEKRMLDLFVENGGKIEQYSLLKQVASADLTELSKAELNKELKAAGFNDTEIAAIQKERYYQLSEEDLEQFDDETEKEFAKRKAEYGKKKLEGKAAHTKEQALEFFNTLKSAVTEKDLQATKESELSSNVEEHFKSVERKMALQLGKVDDVEIDPVEYEVPETVINEAKDLLKDPVTRKQLLYNEDGSFNLKSIGEIVLKAKMFDSVAKTAYLTGGTREVEKFEKIFPMRSAQAVGVGGNSQANTGKPGKIVSAGKPQRFNPAVNQ